MFEILKESKPEDGQGYLKQAFELSSKSTNDYEY